MNSQIQDKLLQEDIPEVIEEYLEHGVMKCIAFNRKGTLLACGCSNGSCVIWDFETRVIVKELNDEDCTTAITSVSWSKYGHYILVSTADKTLNLWEVSTGKKVAQTILKQTSLHAELHPTSYIPSLCLVNPIYSAPFILDLFTGKSTLLPTGRSEEGKFSGSCFSSCFNGFGDLVYLGNSKGEILIIDHHSNQICALVSTIGCPRIKNIVFSKNGMYLLTNSGDGTIRVYENMLPPKNGVKTLCELNETLNDNLVGIEKLKAIGRDSLFPTHEFYDAVSWKASCFSPNGEWIIGGCDGEHKIYIWDCNGKLVKNLKGPKEGLMDLAWHPKKPIVISLSLSGLVYIWAKDYTENWSSFYPGFKEIDYIEEYVEREDEFDIMPETVAETRKVKETEFKDDEDVDIVAMENENGSEMSEEELCFLPSVPCSDEYSAESQKFAANYPYTWAGDCYDSAVKIHGTCPKRQRKSTKKLLESTWK